MHQFPLHSYYNYCAHRVTHRSLSKFFLHIPMYRRGFSLNERTPLGVASITINSIFVGLAALALGIRFNSRIIQGLKLSFNDYAALVAWVWTAHIFMEPILWANDEKPLTVALLVTSCFLGEQIIMRIVVMTNRKKSSSEEELDSMWLTLIRQI